MANPEHADVRLRKPERMQVSMTVGCPDELIGPDHQARVIWSVVERLDLSKFHEPIRARAGTAGRDATDPRLLVALWLYGCTRGVGSARELARRCTESRPYQWLCGGVGVNHHTLSDFRVGHGAALDELFTQVIASLVGKKVIQVSRISQDGTRVRACAGSNTFRRKARLGELLRQARAHVAEVRALLADPEKSAGLSARKRAARTRAAREKQQRLEQAIAQLPELEARQQKRAAKLSKKARLARLREPRASTGDPEARVMKVPGGGFRPSVNVQLATDTASRAIVGVSVVNAGVDAGQLEPMREQVEARAGGKVAEHLADAGYFTGADIERAAASGVALYAPPSSAAADAYAPRAGDGPATAAWRERMGSEQGREIYKQRAATVETANGDLKSHRGLVQLTVRGIAKAQCVALWCALAYNLMHFGPQLLA